MVFPVVKCFGLSLFVLLDRPILVCLDGVAWLHSRSHANKRGEGDYLAAGMCTVFRRRLWNSFASLERF